MESIAEKLRQKADFRFLELETRVRCGSKGFEDMAHALATNKTVRYIYLCGEFFDSLDWGQRKVLFHAIGRLESLRSIYVANAKLSTYSVQDLADMFIAHYNRGTGTLEEISFQHLHVPNGVALDPMVDAIARLPSVERVEIGVLFMNQNQAAFSGSVLSMLCRSKSLRCLTLIDLRLTASHFLAMAEELETNQTLNELQLWGESLEHSHCIPFAKMLEINTTLKSLSLYFGTIDNVGLEAVAKVIGQRSVIQSLSVENEDYSISKSGVVSLIDMLEQNTNLESFSLTTKALEDWTCSRICEVLKSHPTLKQLSLDNVIDNEDGWEDFDPNKPKDAVIGSAGLAAVAAMLKVNKSLERLDLTGLEIDHEGAQTVASALMENTTLRELSLGSTKYDKLEGESKIDMKRALFWSALVELLENNQVLERVSAGENDCCGTYRKRIDLLATLNRQKLRTQMVDVNKPRPRFLDTLVAHSHNLDVLFYLLERNPSFMV